MSNSDFIDLDDDAMNEGTYLGWVSNWLCLGSGLAADQYINSFEDGGFCLRSYSIEDVGH